MRSETQNAIKKYFKLSKICAKERLINLIIVMWGGGVAVLIHPVVFVVLIVHGYTILIKGEFIFYDYY